MSTPTTQDQTLLPGVFDLINGSVSLYRERFSTIAWLALLLWVTSAVVAVSAGLAILGLDALALLSSLPSALVIAGVPVVLGCIGFILVRVWGTLAFSYAYLAETPLTLRGALSRGRPLILPYLWVSILAHVVQVALIVVPIGLSVGFGMLLPASLTFPLVFLLVLGSIGGYAVVCIRLAFSGWCRITGRGSGFGALRASSQLVAGRTLPVLGRFLGFGVLYVGASFLSSMCAGIVGVLFEPLQVLGIIANILIAPVFGIASYLLFKALTQTPVQVSTPQE